MDCLMLLLSNSKRLKFECIRHTVTVACDHKVCLCTSIYIVCVRRRERGKQRPERLPLTPRFSLRAPPPDSVQSLSPVSFLLMLSINLLSQPVAALDVVRFYIWCIQHTREISFAYTVCGIAAPSRSNLCLSDFSLWTTHARIQTHAANQRASTKTATHRERQRGKGREREWEIDVDRDRKRKRERYTCICGVCVCVYILFFSCHYSIWFTREHLICIFNYNFGE